MRQGLRCLLVGLLISPVLASTPAAHAATSTYTDTTTADFNAGATEDGASSQSDDGAIGLSPGSADFDGQALPSGWTFRPAVGGEGSATVQSGLLHLDGGAVRSDVALLPGQILEARVKFTEPGQQIGLQRAGQSSTGAYFTEYDNHKVGPWAEGANFNPTTASVSGVEGQWRSVRVEVGSRSTTFWVETPGYPSGWSTSTVTNAFTSTVVAIRDSVGGSELQVDEVRTTWMGSLANDFGAVPANWTYVSGSNSVGSGMLRVDGPAVSSAGVTTANSMISAGHVVDVWASMSPAVGSQRIRLAGPNNSFAQIESLSTYDTFRFQAGMNITSTAGLVSRPRTGLLNAMHQFRIEWLSDRVVFSIPDVPSFIPVVVSTAITIPMSLSLEDRTEAGVALVVDSVSLTPAPYPTTNFDAASAEWSSTPLVSEGGVVIGSGLANVNGARLGGNSLVPAGRSLDFVATLTGAVNQDIGWGQSLAIGQKRAVLSTTSAGGQIVANGDGTTVALPSSLLNVAHHYRIDWKPDAYVFNVVDDPSISPVSIPTTNGENLRPVISDNNTTAGAVSVDSMRVLPITGHFTSRTFDAGTEKNWSSATWTGLTPAYTAANVRVRVGPTSTPDVNWSTWTPVTNPGDTFSLTGRYAQYDVTFSSSDDFAFPTIDSVTLTADDPPATTDVGDTTSTDFSAGLRDGTEVTAKVDGEVTQAPLDQSSFDGSTLPSQLQTFALDPISTGGPGSYSVSDGNLSVSGADVISASTGAASRSLVFRANFTRGAYAQAVGFAALGPVAGGPYALIGTGYGSDYLQVNVDEDDSGAPLINVPFPSSDGKIDNLPHDYRIDVDPTASIVRYWIDGVEVYDYSGPVPNVAMYAEFLSSHVGDAPLVIDSYRVYGHDQTTTFTSRTLDIGSAPTSAYLVANGIVPSGTSRSIEVRSGTTATPDGSWSAFSPISNYQSFAPSRYVQYRVTFTNGRSADLPILDSLTIYATT